MATVTIQPTDDTDGKDTLVMNAAYVNSNYGTNIQMFLGYRSAWSATARFMVQFDLSPYANATINTATFSTYCESTNENESGNNTMGCYQITASWVESTVTWNLQPTVSGSAESTLVWNANTTGWRAYDIKSLTQDWVNGDKSNYGVMVKNATDGQKPMFNISSSGRASNEPKLYLDYTPAPAGISDRLLRGMGS